MTTETNESQATTGTAKIAAAIAKAQSQLGNAEKDGKNPHFRSNYATLTNCITAVREAFSSNGIAIVQIPRNSEKGIELETVFYHSSGESLSGGCVVVPVDKQNAHGYGSALTYARRYGLATATGLGTEDDDGNAAASAPPKRTTARAAAMDEVKVSAEDHSKASEYVACLREAMPERDSIDVHAVKELAVELATMGDIAILAADQLEPWQRTAMRNAVKEARAA